MRVLAIDPGPTQSAWCVYGDNEVMAATVDNQTLVDEFAGRGTPADSIAIEMIASYGMPVGREVFETCVWIGRFQQALGGKATFVYRRDVKLHLCNSVKAKDANVRQALLDRFGGREKAIGKKREPGPLYGIKGDEWAALAVAVTHADNLRAPLRNITDSEVPF